MPRTAGRVHELEPVQAELVDRGREREVEDELLDELGRLQQREALAGRLRQVLVEVAEEAGVEAPVATALVEGVHEPPISVAAPEEGEQRRCRIGGDVPAPHWVVLVHQRGTGAGGAQPAERLAQPDPLVLPGIRLDPGCLRVQRPG